MVSSWKIIFQLFTTNTWTCFFFSGNINETYLLCQLFKYTFNTLRLPEDVKINFAKSRLRDLSRNWYIAPYNENNHPRTLKELIDNIRKTYANVASKKLSKIQLVKLKYSYGKINEYIEKFRTLTTGYWFVIEWRSFSFFFFFFFFFYNGLYPKFKEEKMDEFPSKPGDIYIMCILFKDNIKSKDQLWNNNSNKNLKIKHLYKQ